MATAELSDRQAILEEIGRYHWIHSIDLGQGIVTPGLWGNHNPALWKALDDIDFRGKKVLDIGCWDGLFSFEAEKRGAAEVYATDLVSARPLLGQPTFQVARQILGSKAIYEPNLSVFDVERLGIRDFDVIIYAGIYYHLRDPLRSFSALRRVLKDGGTMLVEGEVIHSDESFASFHYKKHHAGDPSNWWVPSMGCLREWVESSFLEIVKEYPWTDDSRLGSTPPKHHRMVLQARGVRRVDSNYVYPDPDFQEYDLNRYGE